MLPYGGMKNRIKIKYIFIFVTIIYKNVTTKTNKISILFFNYIFVTFVNVTNFKK